ncbi:MAG: carbohydrate ABC transporter substrate-binding protein [Lachnospiraceae bacterium]|nr:carbohydrate ABC transporter substrate-binding protein [Lachnospiraceae bacterium]
MEKETAWKKYKRVWIIGILLVLTCIIAGCGKEQENKVTITMVHGWGGIEADHVAMRKIYEEFQTENPDIELRLISMPTREEMLRKVEDMIMVGDIPDIVNFEGIGYNQTYDFMVRNDMLIDLMPYLEEDEELASDISETNLKSWTTDEGELYNVVAVLSLSGGYWYNEEILEQAGIRELPATWEEFMEMCETLENWSVSEGTGIKPHKVTSEGYLYFADHVLADSEGGLNWSPQEHRLLVDEDKMEDVLKQLKEIYKYSASDEMNYTYRDETSLFNDGKLAIYINGVWGAPMIGEELDVKYALLPSASGTAISCESACMGYVLGKSNAAEKEEASVRFLKYMLSEEVQTRILEETEQIPSNPQVSLERYSVEKPRMYQAATLVLNAERKIDTPENMWGVDRKEKFTENIMEVLRGDMSGRHLINSLRDDN